MAFDVEYDVVVVGGGGSGKSCAYTVATESDLSVALIEKQSETGGTSKYAEGTCASESIEQQTRPHPDYPGELPAGAHFPSHEEHYERYINYSHHRANPEVVKAFVWNSGETIDIFKKLGIEYSDVTIYAFDQDLELYTFHRPEGLGARCQEVLLHACENAGVDIFVNTPGKDLIIENGKIVGIIAESEGEEMRIGAKAIVLATGGFGDNPDLVAKYSWMPWLKETNFHSMPSENTGDGLMMALSAGCATSSLGTLMIDAVTDGRTLDSQLNGVGFQPNLWLTSEGERFCDESVAMSFADTGNTVAQRRDGIVWSVLDSAKVKHLQEHGSDVGLGDFIRFGQTFPRFEAEVQASLDEKDGAVIVADTLDELAAGMGVDADVLKASVARYNELCELKDDTDFFKPAQFLFPVITAPFYAIKQVPTILVSCGGISVNGNMEVVDDKYEPIGGLYAVGLEASGLYGDTYNLDCPGTANGFAHTSGRIAGRDIIKKLA